MSYIVVGIDGTDATSAAVRWAAREAVRTDADLVAVHAWRPVREPDLRGARSAVRDRTLERVLRALDPDTGDVRVRVDVKLGRPETVLPIAARSAAALVVGYNDVDPPPGARVMIERCVAGAACPVVVVRSSNGVAESGRSVLGMAS